MSRNELVFGYFYRVVIGCVLASNFLTKKLSVNNTVIAIRRVTSAVSMCVLMGVSAQSVHATEVVKWTDENGKVHFGDRAPIGKQDVAEKIKIQHAPVNTPEKEVLKKQTDYWYRQKIAKQKQQEQKQAAKNAAQASSSSNNPDAMSPEDKRRFCRDTFSHNVKMRTECFNNIQTP